MTYAAFKQLPRCQYGVSASWHIDGVADCGEPATVLVSWGDEQTMYVCNKHAEAIELAESQEEVMQNHALLRA